MTSSISIFKDLCKKNSIEFTSKFYKFCIKSTYFNSAYDLRFYVFAPMELSKRASFSINEMFGKFKEWNIKKTFRVYEKEFPQYYDVVKAKTASKAKSIFASENILDFIDVRCNISYVDGV